jgi:pyruvate/2-oxoglutarate dehydrogenase complex dihydrolipoamide acyltransferase (E2) component
MIEVRVPKMGMSTVEVDVSAVLVAPGDDVAAGQTVIEVEGEKASLEVEAPAAGTVTEVLVAVGDECCVGDVVVLLEARG